ncbi:ABC transporter permease [Parasaccharibacter apium]|uniref:ABC transporter permease n=1 Tax=Parasaccharibacter apium TaxID=1510841 RepID=UPI0009DCEDE0|nr:ABC transporter permease [Parasaccharibacter apium]
MPYNNVFPVSGSRRSASRHRSPSLFQAFITQWRVIHALIMREIHTRYGRENIGFLWVIGEPILFCAGVAIVWTAIRPSHEHGLQMTAMVVTGYVPLTMWRHAVQRATKAYAVNSSLLFHQLVTPLDIILARTTLEVLGTILAGVLVLFGSIFLGYMQSPVNWAQVYLGVGFVVYFCYGFSLIVAALTERSDLLEKAMSILSYLSLPLSGAFTMTEWLPARYRFFLEYSPLANGIEMIRAGEFGIGVVPHYSVVFLIFSCTFQMIIGIYLSLKIRPHIELA